MTTVQGWGQGGRAGQAPSVPEAPIAQEPVPGETAPAPAASADEDYQFSGKIESFGDGRLVVAGQDAQGAALNLAFVLGEDAQRAEALQAGETVTVTFRLGEGGAYRATAVRRPANGNPPNRLPGQVPVEEPATAPEQPPTTPEQPPTTPETPAEGERPPVEGEEPEVPSDTAPRIVNIEVEGNQNIPDDEILQVVSTRIGDPLLEPRIRRDMQAIFDLGYFTDVRLDTPYAPGGIRLVFKVLENPMVTDIQVSGNEVVPTQKILELMQTKPGKILNTRTMHADIQAINKYYDTELGYLLAPTHVVDLEFEAGVLSMTLKDGMVVQEVNIEGVTVFPKEQVRALVRVQPGDLFNQKILSEDREKIAELYEQNDYILDSIPASLDPEKGLVTVKVLEATVEEIRVEGNIKTKTATVLRNMRTKPGQVLQRRRVQKDLERLNNLGYFKAVDINPEPGTEPGKVILVLDVEEQKTGLATIGIGYAGGGSGAVRSGVTGAVSLSDRNLFGEGKSLSFQWQRGSQLSTYGLSYFDPAINENQDSIGASVFLNEVDGLRQPVQINGVQEFALYQDRRFGGSLTYGHPFNDDVRGFLTLRRETIEILQDPDSAFTPIGLGKGDLNAVGLSGLYDTRDDVFSPHVGSFANAAVSFAGLGGDFNFTKYTVEGRHYLPLAENHTLAFRGWYGALSGGDAPITEFFFAGGNDTLRGYEQNQFFGTRFLVMNAEYRFPIANIKFLKGAVFADAGNAWIPGGVNDGKIFMDGGVGLRITFPTLGLGVIRVDYAIGSDGGRTSIGIGQSF
ncbi:MAG: BamA/TamA family outer membrane protein [Armatimonadetes bacterium]|nr:BamA/TamA family outer membrane protein [Armatimonadota bacterium]